MSPCLLCLSPAVADTLCVDDGAKKWAALIWYNDRQSAAMYARGEGRFAVPEGPRKDALRSMTYLMAVDFLSGLDAARKAREGAPLCSRGCMSHDDKENDHG